MGGRSGKASFLASAALGLCFATGAIAQTTPGDQSGTPTAAGAGQSATTPTNAPAVPGRAPRASRAADDSNPADIIVTARRVEERLQDVPISITVFNQQQLSNRNVTQGIDLATYTPSLSAGTNFGSQNATFSIRGFYQDPGTQPSVGIYFADVVAPRAASNNLPAGDGAGPGDFFDLQNAQVLKGPQGTLFGRNTTGGAILLVPQKPTSKFEGYVEGSYGNYDMKRIQGVLNVPLGDVARFRIGVDHEDRDGYVHNDTGVGPKRYNDIGYTAARASLVVDLTPNLENYTIVSYLRSDSVGDVQKLVGALPASAFANPVTAGGNLLGDLASAQLAREAGTGFYTAQSTVPNPRTLLTTWRVINTTTWRASDNLTIKNIASYAQLRESYLNPIFGTDFDAHDFPAIAAFTPVGSSIGFALSSPLNGDQTAQQSTMTDELQVQGSTSDGKLNYQFGGYVELTSPLGIAGSESPVLTSCADAANLICYDPVPSSVAVIDGVPVLLGAGNINYTAAKTKTYNHGLYAQATYSLTDQLKLTGGIRYTWDKVTDVNYLRSYQFAYGFTQAQSVGYTCNDPALGTDIHPITDVFGCQNKLKESSHKPTWLIDVDYKPSEDILIYAKWARGYRAGGLVPQAPSALGLQTYSPEKVDDYEIGLKSSFRGALRATFNINGFYNNFSNQQLLSSLAPLQEGLGPASGIINAGKSRIYGVEVETSITPFTGFTLDGSYTYLHARLRKVNNLNASNGAYLITFPAQAGDPLPLAPNHKFSITGTYRLPFDDSVGRVSLSATGVYTSRQLNNYLDKLPYYLAPLRVGTVDVPGVGTLPAAALGGTIVDCPASPFGCEQVAVPKSIRKYAYQPSRFLLNLNLNWNNVVGSPIDVQLFATNVLAKKYFSYAAGLIQSTQFETAQFGEPRMFGGRVRYHF